MPSQGTGLTLQRRKAENEQNNDPILYDLSGRFFFSPVVVAGVCDKQSTNTALAQPPRKASTPNTKASVTRCTSHQ